MSLQRYSYPTFVTVQSLHWYLTGLENKLGNNNIVSYSIPMNQNNPIAKPIAIPAKIIAAILGRYLL